MTTKRLVKYTKNDDSSGERSKKAVSTDEMRSNDVRKRRQRRPAESAAYGGAQPGAGMMWVRAMEGLPGRKRKEKGGRKEGGAGIRRGKACTNEPRKKCMCL